MAVEQCNLTDVKDVAILRSVLDFPYKFSSENIIKTFIFDMIDICLNVPKS